MSRKPLENQISEVIYTDEYIASMVFNWIFLCNRKQTCKGTVCFLC